MYSPSKTPLSDELLSVIRDGRRSRRRRKALGKFATALILAALSWLLRGWSLMLAAAVIHDHWIPQMPTLGYWWAVLIAGLLHAAIGHHVSAPKDKTDA